MCGLAVRVNWNRCIFIDCWHPFWVKEIQLGSLYHRPAFPHPRARKFPFNKYDFHASVIFQMVSFSRVQTFLLWQFIFPLLNRHFTAWWRHLLTFWFPTWQWRPHKSSDIPLCLSQGRQPPLKHFNRAAMSVKASVSLGRKACRHFVWAPGRIR